VRFAGPVGHDRMPDWYRAADLTVLPSLSEGTPNVLLESVACETPFVASDVGGIPALSRCPEDELVPAGDPAALARRVRRRLGRPLAQPEAAAPPFRWRDSAAMLIDVVRALPGSGARPVT
jgi:glycosyltransferase involved in cell wall biosynthesis